MKGHLSRTNIVKNEKSDLVTDSHSILASMYMGLVMSGRQKYIQQNHKWLSPVPLRMSWLLKTKGHKSPDIYQIPAELIKNNSFLLKHLLLFI